MVEAAQAHEPDTMIYEYFISEDNKSCQIYERYTDSAAAMTHLGNFGEEFAERLWAIVEPKEFKVYGNPSDELREMASGVGTVFLTLIGSFAR